MAAAIALLLTGCATAPTSTEDASVDAGIATPTSARPLRAPTVEPMLALPLRTHYVDLFARVRAGFELQSVDDDRIDAQVEWLRRNPAYVERAAQRSAPYLHHIVSEVERRGLPLELALLPVVESGFDPFAYSSGRAAGLWQFIAGTGAAYGLERDWWHDERRDVLEATRAALEHLDDLQARFDGDWLLALAAYNAGPRAVTRARRRAGDDADYFALPLPRETRAYVPRLLAVARVVADPAAHGIALPAIADTPAFVVVEVGGQLDLRRAASIAELDADALRALNPQLSRFATHPQGPHRLLLPQAAGARLESGLQTLPDEDRLSWRRHEIVAGDTLSGIAQRYGVSSSALRQVNGLRSTFIRAGDALLVPLGDVDARSAVVDDAGTVGTGKRARTHRVRAGDSLWEIARRHDTTVAALARQNGLAPSATLRIGQSLTLPQGEPGLVSTGVQRTVTYKVRNGDSYWRIANRFGVAIADLLDWNALKADQLLQPGQRLRLHVPVTGR